MSLGFSINDASLKAGIGKTKLYEAINSGALRAKKFGKRTIILREDLETFLNSLEAYPAQSEAKEC